MLGIDSFTPLLDSSGEAKDIDALTYANYIQISFQTFAVGVVPLDSKLDIAELEIIAGDRERVIIAEEGYIDLNEDFARQLSKDVCGDPCLQPNLEDI